MRLTMNDVVSLVTVDKMLESKGLSDEDPIRVELTNSIIRLRRDLFEEDLWGFLESMPGTSIYVPGVGTVEATREAVALAKRTTDDRRRALSRANAHAAKQRAAATDALEEEEQ